MVESESHEKQQNNFRATCSRSSTGVEKTLPWRGRKVLLATTKEVVSAAKDETGRAVVKHAVALIVVLAVAVAGSVHGYL